MAQQAVENNVVATATFVISGSLSAQEKATRLLGRY